ncbi:hypothetical protein M430DRAFT_155867 [Amorphotheca resinae ATCC 22711]|uniref:C2H2-type domain-containing protein n=1 Tax=Amorphotheca resinae ATCC 22711 TaxID=857342 RepID=A0A2T3BDV2_AMORE|nr:hypothetical protein M430DRAFT_155867 [Amorphotheca resinae ATCC 22711]PSS27581.1 hypothetical protein M430DRAFT_155867 [Amorphotheca resinae ATCC 22711]
MEYNTPYGEESNGRPFPGCNTSNQQVYRRQDFMEVGQTWVETLDPLLYQGQIQNLHNPEWRQHQQPLQRFVNEPERAFFTAGPLSSRPSVNRPDMNGSFEAVSSLPGATGPRMASPSLSHELSSQCSSARSPETDPEWYSDTYYSSQDQDYLSKLSGASHFPPGPPNVWVERPQTLFYPQDSVYSCVNMKQVQGLPDLQNATFAPDEGYMETAGTEYVIEVEPRVLTEGKQQAEHHHWYAGDEGLGASIKDAESPQESVTTPVETDEDADADVDAEYDAALDEEASDAEYTPKSTRTRKRRALYSTKTTSSFSAKRGRVTKSSRPVKPNKSPSSSTCKACNTSFKNPAALQLHMNNTHPRALVCVFGFAGCKSTFMSKNEWKRHVSTKHLSLYSWICQQGACGINASPSSSKHGSMTKGATFNRKDLFTQHLRRMHTPVAVKRQDKKNPAWEERIKELQTSCRQTNRQMPTTLRCPAQGCTLLFEGYSCWDDRMEHLAKHLEETTHTKGSGIQQESDDLFIAWALNEKIIERTGGATYQLAGVASERVSDKDADGEDE